jgi:hypothetical protein
MVATNPNSAQAIAAAILAVTKDWCRQRKAEEQDAARVANRRDRLARRERPLTVKAAAWAVMEWAYSAASNNNQLPANARQVMYAAGPKILQMTGRDSFKDDYFTQTLLPDFTAAYPELCSDWDVVFDARGNFTEPHTGRNIGLGTLEVRNYLHGRPPLSPATGFVQSRVAGFRPLVRKTATTQFSSSRRKASTRYSERHRSPSGSTWRSCRQKECR